MNRIYNPFLEGETDGMTETAIIIDKRLNGSNEQKQVFGFLAYYCGTGNDSKEELDRILIGELGEDRVRLIRSTYTDTYDPQTKKMTKYAYFVDKNDVRLLYETVEMLYKILPKLRMIAGNS